jgi:hypothetical protein
MFVGPATINIAGPAGSGVEGTIGTDSAGLIYTEGGFASPSIIVGPAIVAGSTTVGAVGGWELSVTGSSTGTNYDLVAQQNVNTAFGGLTGPVYSLIQGPLRSITSGTGIAITGSGTTGQVVSLATTGPGATTIGYPASVSLNAYGQVTAITEGSGSVGTLSQGTTATAYQNQLVLYNTATEALSYYTDAYSCVVEAAPITEALASTMRGRTYIVTGTGVTVADRTITFTTSTLTANDVGFFAIVKNGNAAGAGNRDITIAGATGNTTVHEATTTQNGQVVYVYWDGTALIAY